MGNSQSSDSRQEVKDQDVPMPGKEELESKFTETLEELNLPAAEVEKMKNLPDEKKWKVVLESGKSHSKHPPSFYTTGIKVHSDPKLIKKRAAGKKIPKDMIASETYLSELEISLRTSPLSWLKEFVDEPNNGHLLIFQYLQSLIKMGASTFSKDIYSSVQCIKALSNNAYGFRHLLAFEDGVRIIVGALSIPHEKTIITSLELLSAISVVGGEEGHKKILESLEEYKILHNESRRFETLVKKLEDENVSIDLRATILTFIDVIVHSPKDSNFQVYLQYELTLLGIENILEKLKKEDIEKINTVVVAYQENCIDVDELLTGERIPRNEPEVDPETAAKMKQYLDKIVELEKELLQSKDDNKRLTLNLDSVVIFFSFFFFFFSIP